jgi:hypothetical protein
MDVEGGVIGAATGTLVVNSEGAVLSFVAIFPSFSLLFYAVCSSVHRPHVHLHLHR